MSLVGCGSDPNATDQAALNSSSFKGSEAASAAGIGHRYWHPRPVKIIFFPGTRWVQQNREPVITTAIELRDAMGDPTKAAGTLRLQWVKPSTSGQNDTVLNTWTIQLKTLEDQQTHWSPILRSYALDLTVGNASHRKNKTLLIATYVAPGSASTPIRAEFELNAI